MKKDEFPIIPPERPGFELKQILARGARFRDRLLTVYPDIYINYYICQLTGGRNRENGRRFLEFIRSGRAGEIYRKYGFVPHE